MITSIRYRRKSLLSSLTLGILAIDSSQRCRRVDAGNESRSRLELDLVGPLEVFAGANRVLGERGPAYDIRVVSSQPKPIIAGECGVSLLAHGYYRRLREPIDTLVVVGGPTSKNTRDSRLSLWLQKMAGRVRRVASVCVGAFVLAEAGLLRNKRATTHWAFASELQKKYPDVKVDGNPIWIQDGNIDTAAGVTAGIDLALAMVEEDLGAFAP